MENHNIQAILGNKNRIKNVNFITNQLPQSYQDELVVLQNEIKQLRSELSWAKEQLVKKSLIIKLLQ